MHTETRSGGDIPEGNTGIHVGRDQRAALDRDITRGWDHGRTMKIVHAAVGLVPVTAWMMTERISGAIESVSVMAGKKDRGNSGIRATPIEGRVTSRGVCMVGSWRRLLRDPPVSGGVLSARRAARRG